MNRSAGYFRLGKNWAIGEEKEQPEDCGRLCVSRIARYFFRL
jgi:hypothetical protein